MTYMLLLNCALKLVEEIILYYDARPKEHQSILNSLQAFPSVKTRNRKCELTFGVLYLWH